MSTPVESVYIYEVATAQEVEAELRHAIEARQLLDWKNEWRPACSAAIEDCASKNQIDRIPNTFHWEWDRKVNQMQGLLAAKGFCVVCNNMTQGMMAVTTTGFARHPSQKGKPIVYIDYLETAPWNLADFVPPGIYKSVGSVLVQAAVNLSYDEDFSGRIGLHSVPKAEQFYRNRCGMADMGIDEKKEGLRYFEMTAEQALAFAR